MGKLIVIEGLDGSGKGTQSRALAKYLEEKGRSAKRIDFPRYKTKGATLVEGYLNGELGGNPDDTGAYATSLFFAMDRFEESNAVRTSAAGDGSTEPNLDLRTFPCADANKSG